MFETARLPFEMVTSQNLCVQEAIPQNEKTVWPNLNPNQHNLPPERVLCQNGKQLPKLCLKVPRQTEQALVMIGPEKMSVRCTMGKLKITSLKEYSTARAPLRTFRSSSSNLSTGLQMTAPACCKSALKLDQHTGSQALSGYHSVF